MLFVIIPALNRCHKLSDMRQIVAVHSISVGTIMFGAQSKYMKPSASKLFAARDQLYGTIYL